MLSRLSIISRRAVAFAPQALANFKPATSMRTMSHRKEYDTFGEILVPSDRYWGAQTQRSIENFDICRDTDRMPIQVIHAMAVLKSAAATVNMKINKLDPKVAGAISQTCEEIMKGKLDSHFPLVVW